MQFGRGVKYRNLQHRTIDGRAADGREMMRMMLMNRISAHAQERKLYMWLVMKRKWGNRKREKNKTTTKGPLEYI